MIGYIENKIKKRQTFLNFITLNILRGELVKRDESRLKKWNSARYSCLPAEAPASSGKLVGAGGEPDFGGIKGMESIMDRINQCFRSLLIIRGLEEQIKNSLRVILAPSPGWIALGTIIGPKLYPSRMWLLSKLDNYWLWRNFVYFVTRYIYPQIQFDKYSLTMLIYN